jgi:predicted phage tail protein
MCATVPGFRKKVQDGKYFVRIGGKESISHENIHLPSSEKETLRIVPAVAGASELGDILLGAALIGLSFMIPQSIGAIDLALATGISVTTMASFVSSIGVSLLLGGISKMLFSPPKPPKYEAANNLPSYSFDGAINTIAQGNPVPLCYGRLIVGSQVVSTGLSVEQIAIENA